MNTATLQLMPSAITSGSIESYIHKVNQIPLLTLQEEEDLTRRLYYQQDLEAARQLVMSHLRFVVRIARGYLGYGLNHADLIQEGNLGLMKAVKRFDPNKGVRLVTFALHWIKAEIHEFVLKNWRIVKVSTTKAQRKLFFNLRKASNKLGWLSQSEVTGVAEDLGVTEKEVRTMEMRMSAVDMGFDQPADHDEERIPAPANFLEDQSSDPANLLEANDDQQSLATTLNSALDQLSERERGIVTARHLIEADVKRPTLQALSAEYGVSLERVRQIEKEAMRKLESLISS